MPREQAAMSGDEIAAFLAQVEWVALGTLAPGGAPRASAVPAVARDGWLFLAVARSSAAAADLLADPRCCCSADVFPSYYEIKGATAHGRAARVEPDAALRDELAARARRHGLADGEVFALPLLEDAFGFDFAKLQRR